MNTCCNPLLSNNTPLQRTVASVPGWGLGAKSGWKSQQQQTVLEPWTCNCDYFTYFCRYLSSQRKTCTNYVQLFVVFTPNSRPVPNLQRRPRFVEEVYYSSCQNVSSLYSIYTLYFKLFLSTDYWKLLACEKNHWQTFASVPNLEKNRKTIREWVSYGKLFTKTFLVYQSLPWTNSLQ